MKKILSLVLAILMLCTMTVFSFAAEVNNSTESDADPNAYGYYNGEIQLKLNIPKFTSSSCNYTDRAWVCPITIKYRITYDLHTGKIISCNNAHSHIVPGTAISRDGHGHLTALNKENIDMNIVNNGYSLSCNYSAVADITYFQMPTISYNPEYVQRDVSASATVSPPRP